MNKSWVGTAMTGLIVVGIGGFLLLNLQPGGTSTTRTASATPSPTSGTPATTELAKPVAGSMAVREYPIGDEVEKNHIRVAAVWLPAVMMDSMPADPNSHMVHIEADVKATEDNPNGFAKDEKVSYLKIAYLLFSAGGGIPIAAGELTPMMARDGFHYGATIALPSPGQYNLVYEIQPPSAGGLGRHSDPATGVAPWWEPFQAKFDWTVEKDSVEAASVSSQ